MKKLLEYGAIGFGILILLLLFFSKKKVPSQAQATVVPAQFGQPAPLSFQGISAQPTPPYDLNNIPLFFSLNISKTPSATCGICNNNNKLDNYVWGNTYGTA